MSSNSFKCLESGYKRLDFILQAQCLLKCLICFLINVLILIIMKYFISDISLYFMRHEYVNDTSDDNTDGG